MKERHKKKKKKIITLNTNCMHDNHEWDFLFKWYSVSNEMRWRNECNKNNKCDGKMIKYK